MRGKGFQSCKGQFLIGITPAYAGKRHNTVCWQLLIEDHPRLCGEKQVICVCRCFLAGSPPPMRGKASKAICIHHSIRITPAYAGKRLSLFSIASLSEDHPRLCGEKLLVRRTVMRIWGSPPPMRGKGVSGFSLNLCT